MSLLDVDEPGPVSGERGLAELHDRDGGAFRLLEEVDVLKSAPRRRDRVRALRAEH